MVRFSPGDEDVRVQRGKHVYYVRLMKHGSSPIGRWDSPPAESVILLPLIFPIAWAWSRLQRNWAWKVVVLSTGAPDAWAEQKLRMLSSEEVPTDSDARAALERLVAAVHDGVYDTP
jgi:hypothetical protein